MPGSDDSQGNSVLKNTFIEDNEDAPNSLPLLLDLGSDNVFASTRPFTDDV
jgi:hypothetical protein